MKPTIDELKNKRLLWQASQVSAAQNTLPSGFEALDAHLQGGLPEQGVVDVSTAIGVYYCPVLYCVSKVARSYSCLLHRPFA